MRRKLALLPILFILASCGILGVATPQTFNQRAAAAYVSVTAVRSTSNTLLRDRKLSSADHANVEQQADTARAGIDIATTVVVSDPTGADAKLDAAITITTALEAYLRSKQ